MLCKCQGPTKAPGVKGSSSGCLDATATSAVAAVEGAVCRFQK